MEYRTASPWGYLFTKDKKPTPLLRSLLRAIVSHIINHLEPRKVRHLTPAKLATFYKQVGGDLDALFLNADPLTVSDVYTILGCVHSLLPDPDDDFSPPRIPALLPRGFERWQVIQLLLDPEEHAPYMMEAVRKFQLVDPQTGRDFLTEYGELPRDAFPDTPDEDTVEWHTNVYHKRIQDDEEREKKGGWLSDEESKRNSGGAAQAGRTKSTSGPANAGGGRRLSQGSNDGLGIHVDHPTEEDEPVYSSTERPRERPRTRPASRDREGLGRRGDYDSPSYSPHDTYRKRREPSPSSAYPATTSERQGRRHTYRASSSSRHTPNLSSDSDGEHYPRGDRDHLHPNSHSHVHYVYGNGDEHPIDEANIRSVSPGDAGYTPSPPHRGRGRDSQRGASPYSYFTYGGYGGGGVATPDEIPLPKSKQHSATSSAESLNRQYRRYESPGATAGAQYLYSQGTYPTLSGSRSHSHLRESAGGGGHHYSYGSSPSHHHYHSSSSQRRNRSHGPPQAHSRSRGASPSPTHHHSSSHRKSTAAAAGGGKSRSSRKSRHHSSQSPTGSVEIEIPIPPPPPPPAPGAFPADLPAPGPAIATGGTPHGTPKFTTTVDTESEEEYEWMQPSRSKHHHSSRHYSIPATAYHAHPEIPTAAYHVLQDQNLPSSGGGSGRSTSKRHYETEFLRGRRERLATSASVGGVPYGGGVVNGNGRNDQGIHAASTAGGRLKMSSAGGGGAYMVGIGGAGGGYTSSGMGMGMGMGMGTGGVSYSMR